MNAISQVGLEPVHSSGSATVQLATFSLGDQLFGIPALRVRDILRQQPLTSIPLSSPEIAGTMNLRGHIVTAIDLGARMALGARVDDGSFMCVVIEELDDQFCLLVESVGDVLTADVKDIEPNPASLSEKWAELSKGILRLPDRLLIVLDSEKLLSF